MNNNNFNVELLTILQRQSEQIADIALRLTDLTDRFNDKQYQMKTPNNSDKSIITLQQYKDSLVNAEQMFLSTARLECVEVLQIRYAFKLLIRSIEIITNI
jgi:hypothetical protein